MDFTSDKICTAVGKQKSTAVSYTALFTLFLFGSISGFLLEGLWCVVQKGAWESHSATIWGPFCIIYGFGAVAVYLLSCVLRNKNILAQFVVFSLSGAAVEYFGSLFQELCFGSTSWDYSDQFMNIGGRVSLQMTLIWGFLGVLFVRLAYPMISRLLQRIKGKWSHPAS